MIDPKYIDVQTIDEHMTKYMCYGLGIDKVLDALRLCDSKPSVAIMYWHALKAEHCSSMAKYIDPEFYSHKEMQIQQLIDLCRKWRNPRSTHIVEENRGRTAKRTRTSSTERPSTYSLIKKIDSTSVIQQAERSGVSSISIISTCLDANRSRFTPMFLLRHSTEN